MVKKVLKTGPFESSARSRNSSASHRRRSPYSLTRYRTSRAKFFARPGLVRLQVERHVDVVGAHDVHQERHGAVGVVARTPPAHVDGADPGIGHPPRMLLEHSRRPRIVRAEQRHARRGEIGRRIAFPLLPMRPRRRAVPRVVLEDEMPAQIRKPASKEGRGAFERRSRLYERRKRGGRGSRERAADEGSPRDHLRVLHAFQDLAELLDFVAVERPVAVTLRLQRTLVVLLRERGERVEALAGPRRRGRRPVGDRRRRRWRARLGERADGGRRRTLDPRRARAEDPVQGARQRFFHHDLVLMRDDDPLQLRDPAAGGAQVERPDVQERLLDRDDQQRSLDHLRPLLVP